MVESLSVGTMVIWVSFGVCLVLVDEFLDAQVFAMLTVFLVDSSFGTDLQVLLDDVLSLLNHLDHIFLFAVPFYFLYLPFVNLRPQFFNLFGVGFNLFVQLFLTQILFVKFLHQGLINFLEFFSLLQN